MVDKSGGTILLGRDNVKCPNMLVMAYYGPKADAKKSMKIEEKRFQFRCQTYSFISTAVRFSEVLLLC